MLAFFIGIVAITASITTGILFYVFPSHASSDVKGLSTHQKPSSTPTPLFSLFIDSPTPQDQTTVSVTAIKSVSLTQPPSIITPIVITITPTSTLTSTQTPSPTEYMISLQTPTPTKTVSHTLTPSPTSISNSAISPTPTAIPTIAVTPVNTPQNTQAKGLNADVIFNLVNQHRNSIGLPALQKDSRVCAIAEQRAPQVYNEIFITHNLDAGLHAMQIPYWITEDIINDDTEQDAVDWWLGDPTHRQVIEGNYSYSCVACSGNNCVQVFTNFVAK